MVKMDSKDKAGIIPSLLSTTSSGNEEKDIDGAGKETDNDANSTNPNTINIEGSGECVAAFDIDAMLKTVENNPSLHLPLLELSQEFINVHAKQKMYESSSRNSHSLLTLISYKIMQLSVHIPLHYWLPNNLPPDIYIIGKKIGKPHKVVFRKFSGNVVSFFIEETDNSKYFQLLNENFSNELVVILRQIRQSGKINVRKENLIIATAFKLALDKYPSFSPTWFVLFDIILIFISPNFKEQVYGTPTTDLGQRIQQLNKFIKLVLLRMINQINEPSDNKENTPTQHSNGGSKEGRLTYEIPILVVENHPANISEKKSEKLSGRVCPIRSVQVMQDNRIKNNSSTSNNDIITSRIFERSCGSGITVHNIVNDAISLKQCSTVPVSLSTGPTKEKNIPEKIVVVQEETENICPPPSVNSKNDSTNKLTQLEIYLAGKFLPAIIKLFSPEAIKSAETTLENFTEEEKKEMNENRERALYWKRFIEMTAFLLKEDSLKTKTVLTTYLLGKQFKSQVSRIEHYWKKINGNKSIDTKTNEKHQEPTLYPNPQEIGRPWRGIEALTCAHADVLKEVNLQSKVFSAVEQKREICVSESEAIEIETDCSCEDCQQNVEQKEIITRKVQQKRNRKQKKKNH